MKPIKLEDICAGKHLFSPEKLVAVLNELSSRIEALEKKWLIVCPCSTLYPDDMKKEPSTDSVCEGYALDGINGFDHSKCKNHPSTDEVVPLAKLVDGKVVAGEFKPSTDVGWESDFLKVWHENDPGPLQAVWSYPA